VEGLGPHLHVLHAEPFGDVAEQAAPINRETESAGIHKGGAHPRVDNRYLSSAHGVSVERHGPLTMVRLHFGGLEWFSLDVAAADVGAELAPDLLTARPEQLSQRRHESSVIVSP